MFALFQTYKDDTENENVLLDTEDEDDEGIYVTFMSSQCTT